ncbi:NucA/NucB deoxyribonuclease domain-containing protein [Pendulispora brunnea]|uniref:NucA/NucB deoxyribonuclease domain-containing protein n=1 Tax=Pendulispora brunnea TaxID=2905690 RepID=A0ABZ2JY94_9BACT
MLPGPVGRHERGCTRREAHERIAAEEYAADSDGERFKLRGPNGGQLFVKSREDMSGIAKVYNFEVAGSHSYYVGDVQALVHNNCGGAALPELEISASEYPNLAENISHAQNAGHSSVLTHGGNRVANRSAALDGVPQIHGLSRDEYPFASSKEGGPGSWVGHVPAREQNAQGGADKELCEGKRASRRGPVQSKSNAMTLSTHKDEIALSRRMYFSYNQFMIFDSGEKQPGSDWTDEHVQQGFIRRAHTVSFGTICEFGDAELRVFCRAFEHISNYDRAIEVPLHVVSGRISIEGPEEDERPGVDLAEGHYRITVAQRLVKEEHEEIDVFIEPAAGPVEKSRILIADHGIAKRENLLEQGRVAGGVMLCWGPHGHW